MARQMKDSGIEWIGEIPETWEIRKHKTLFDCSKEIVGEASAITQLLSLTTHGIRKKGQEVSAGKVPESFDTYQTVAPDDIVMCLFDLDCSAVFSGISPYQGMISPAYKVLKCKGEIIPLFADYWFKFVFDGRKFRTYAKNLRYTLTYDEFAMLSLALPSLVEQGRIAAFLDRKCAEIDAVIERTKATIEEYKKLKQAVITEAVTKGVRGPRPMKDSGIEWIGEIPEGWEVLPHKYVMHKEKAICEHHNGEDIISLTMNGVIVRDLTAGGKMPTTFDGYQYVEPEDMLLCLFDIDVTPRCVGVVRNYGVTSPAYSRFKVHAGYHNAYYDYLLRFIDDEKVFIHLAKNLRSSLTETDFGAIKTIAPLYEEQMEIAAYLDEKCAAMDTLIAKKTALLTELETYKKSLIYEYVTGKKEVPVAAQPATAVYPFYPAVLNTKVLRFAQAVLMARILDRHGKGIGRVKLEKMLYTIETSIGFDFDTEYVREAAGPLHESLYQCEGIIATRNHWYQKRESDYGVSYTPTHAVERYRSYYDKYFTDYDAEIERIIDIFRPYNTNQAEIIATLFAAWNDAIIDGKSFTDEDIVDDVLNNWHDSKKRFPKDVWFRAMEQMRKHNLVPRGYGKHTIIRRNPV